MNIKYFGSCSAEQVTSLEMPIFLFFLYDVAERQWNQTMEKKSEKKNYIIITGSTTLLFQILNPYFKRHLPLCGISP